MLRLLKHEGNRFLIMTFEEEMTDEIRSCMAPSSLKISESPSEKPKSVTVEEDWEREYVLSNLRVMPASEEEYAAWLERHGWQVNEHRGRFWKKNRGFYEPVHWMARFHGDEVGKPCRCCWGYRATLEENSVHLANGSLPLHLFDEMKGFGAHRLCKTRRWDVRKCLKFMETFHIDCPESLLREGFELFCANYSRTRYGLFLNRKSYNKYIERYFDNKFFSVLGGIIDGRLSAYMITYVIESTAYLDSIIMNESGRLAQACTGLQFAMMKHLGRNNPEVVQVVDGMHARERPHLDKYKEKWGFRVAQIPSRYWFFPGAAAPLKFFWPDKFYRLTGQG